MDWRLWSEVMSRLTGPVHHADLSVDDTVAQMAGRALTSVPQPVHVVGFSLGAIVALEIMRQHRAAISTLVLIGLNPGPVPPNGGAARRAQAVRARYDLAAVVREELLPRYFAGPPPTTYDAVILAMAKALGPDVFQQQATAQIARPDSTDDLTKLDLPCLVACGAEDRLTPPSMHADTARRIPGAELETFCDAGHLVPLEAPGPLADAIDRFHGAHS